MFDVGFSELVLLGLVALVVIGPERLPQAIRTTSLWINRIRRSINTIKAEIETEIGTDEIRRQLHNEDIMRELKESREQLKGLVKDAKVSLQEVESSTKQLTSIPTESTKDDQNKQRIAGN